MAKNLYQLVLFTLFLASTILNFPGTMMADTAECPYPCYPPPIGTSNSPPATTFSPPSQTGPYSPPAYYTPPSGYLPYNPPPPYGTLYGPPPPDPILPYFPYYYRKPLHQTSDQSSAMIAPRRSMVMIFTSNLLVVLTTCIFSSLFLD